MLSNILTYICWCRFDLNFSIINTTSIDYQHFSSGITTFFLKKFILFSINKVLLACYANFILLLVHVLAWLPQRCNHIIDHDHVFVSKIWTDPALSIACSPAVCQISQLIWWMTLPPFHIYKYIYIYIYIFFFLGYENNSSFDNFFCMHKLVHRWRIRLQVLQEFDHTQINLWRYILVQYFSYLWISLPACLFLFCIVPPPFRIGNMMT